MIKKISSIKELGIFSNCQWPTSLKEFCQFNLIYGWNGSGKTTLTKLFNILGGGNKAEFPNCTFRIESEEGVFLDSDVFAKNIRVFNQDYVERNIALQNSKTNPIFILGEENKELADQIESDKIILNGDNTNPESIGLIAKLKQVKEKIASKTSEKSKLFTDVAKLIGASTTGVLSRNYRKPQAESEFGKLSEKELLSKEEVGGYETTLRQREMSSNLPKLNTKGLLSTIHTHVENSRKLLAETVESNVISKLSDNESTSNWVEQGLKIHTDNNLDTCEFCEQTIPAERLNSLLAHFNDADKILKEKIDKSLSDLRDIYKKVGELTTIDPANLYEEFRDVYSDKRELFLSLKEKLLASITSHGESLNRKKMNTTMELELSDPIDTDSINICSEKIDSIIQDHCEKSIEFETLRNTAASKLEKHYLSGIFDSAMKLTKEIEILESSEETLKNGNEKDKLGIAQLKSRIEDNKNKISNAGPAVGALNNGLETFLGRSEISFSLDDEGYSIFRSGKPISNLSEGEKTAIAFVYFTIHLQDIDFDRTNGVIIIDDPISSLDSNSLFQAFSFLKNAVKDAHQVFVFTHNFDFLKLLLGWLKNGVKNNQRSYYMIRNVTDSNIRLAVIDKLDDALEKFESEYQYLFKILDEFTTDGTISSVYHIPNVARKVLETFLMLTYPDNLSIYRKMEKIHFDENKKTAIYKFTNDQSHMTGKGFDPSLVPECQNNIKYLLEMIQSVFPSHYDSLKNPAT